MEYRHLSKMRGTKKLLWNWNISLIQILMDCLTYKNMKSCNKQRNTLPQLWSLLISIFNSSRNSMEFHGTRQKFHGILWNSMELSQVEREVPWNSMELWKFHETWCQHQIHGIQWNSMESPDLKQKFHGIPWNLKSSMEFGYITKFHGIPWNHYNQLRSSMESHEILKVPWILAI